MTNPANVVMNQARVKSTPVEYINLNWAYTWEEEILSDRQTDIFAPHVDD